MKSPGYPGAFSLHTEPCVAAVEQGASADLTRYDEQEDDPGPDPERAGAGSASARKHLIDAITDEQQRAQRCAEEQERREKTSFQLCEGDQIDCVGYTPAAFIPGVPIPFLTLSPLLFIGFD